MDKQQALQKLGEGVEFNGVTYHYRPELIASLSEWWGTDSAADFDFDKAEQNYGYLVEGLKKYNAVFGSDGLIWMSNMRTYEGNLLLDDYITVFFKEVYGGGYFNKEAETILLYDKNLNSTGIELGRALNKEYPKIIYVAADGTQTDYSEKTYRMTKNSYVVITN